MSEVTDVRQGFPPSLGKFPAWKRALQKLHNIKISELKLKLKYQGLRQKESIVWNRTHQPTSRWFPSSKYRSLKLMWHYIQACFESGEPALIQCNSLLKIFWLIHLFQCFSTRQLFPLGNIENQNSFESSLL